MRHRWQAVNYFFATQRIRRLLCGTVSYHSGVTGGQSFQHGVFTLLATKVSGFLCVFCLPVGKSFVCIPSALSSITIVGGTLLTKVFGPESLNVMVGHE